MIFLIFLLLFNIKIDHSGAYFSSPDDKLDLNGKQCFCEVSSTNAPEGSSDENEKKNFLFNGTWGTRKHNREATTTTSKSFFVYVHSCFLCFLSDKCYQLIATYCLLFFGHVSSKAPSTIVVATLTRLITTTT